jgi:hypothetical protein
MSLRIVMSEKFTVTAKYKDTVVFSETTLYRKEVKALKHYARDFLMDAIMDENSQLGTLLRPSYGHPVLVNSKGEGWTEEVECYYGSAVGILITQRLLIPIELLGYDDEDPNIFIYDCKNEKEYKRFAKELAALRKASTRKASTDFDI